MMDRLDPSLDAAGRSAWLRSVRRRDSATSLAELLGSCRLTVEERLELACADVFARDPEEPVPVVETYLQMFPDLADSDEYVLDLIDAEICCKRQRDLPVDPQAYGERFPRLAGRLQALVAVDEIETSLSDPTDFSFDGSFASELAPTGVAMAGPAASQDCSIYCSVKLPEDVRLTGLIALREDVVCLRGHSNDQATLLVKVVARRRLGSAAGTEAIGDALEALSELKHPAWVRADVIAEDRTHLAMVRPFVSGMPLLDRLATADGPTIQPALRQLAELGYALAAAHDAGMVHGAVHPNNLFRDLQGQLRIVDASFGFPDTGTQWAWPVSQSPVSAKFTRHVDVRAYAKIVATFLRGFCAATENSSKPSAAEIEPVAEWFETNANIAPTKGQSPSVAEMADQLLAIADGRPVKLPGLSSRSLLSTWFQRK